MAGVTTILGTDKIKDSRAVINTNFDLCILEDGSNPLTANWDAGAFKITIEELSTDTISEETAAAGVTIDGLQIKDSEIIFAAVDDEIAGIENQNLVDKAATEIITGSWQFELAIIGKEISTPANPTAGYNKLYFKLDVLYSLDSDGNETRIGEVLGPGSSTNNALVVWNGTGGDTVKDSSVLIGNVVDKSAVETITGAWDFDTAVPTISAGDPSNDNEIARKSWIDAQNLDWLRGTVLEATVAFFQVNAASGTMATPSGINDNNTEEHATADTAGKYASVNFGKVVQIQRWRQFGTINTTGDGRWKIQYYSLYTHAWVDWVTGIAQRTTADWSDYTTETVVVTDKIKLICTTVDSGVWDSTMGELEILY